MDDCKYLSSTVQSNDRRVRKGNEEESRPTDRMEFVDKNCLELSAMGEYQISRVTRKVTASETSSVVRAGNGGTDETT